MNYLQIFKKLFSDLYIVALACVFIYIHKQKVKAEQREKMLKKKLDVIAKQRNVDINNVTDADRLFKKLRGK